MTRLLLALTLLLSSAGAACAATAEILPKEAPHQLAAGQKVQLTFDLPARRSVAIRVSLRDADFAGATLLARVNDRALLPYHAFGGDTRYDNVKGRTDLSPPLAKIEANYVLVADWVKAGPNTFTLTNAGPGTATLESVAVRDASGHNLPLYQNPIYFDFDVWRQGSTMRPGIPWNLDTMLLGVIPGGGTHVMSYSGGDGAAVKLGAEDARTNWGYARSTFYSIWHLVTTSKEWAQFLDVDNNKTTTGQIHVQFANAPDVPPGTDIALIKPDGYLNAVKAGIDGLLAYSSDYNFTCEQWGPRGQGFGRWWGDKHADKGYDAKKWADNYQGEFSKLTGYVHQKNPGAPVMAPHWWIPDIRFLLYDSSPARGTKMRDMTDTFMTHYYSFPFGDYGPDGKPVMEDDKKPNPITHPELQYPGGKFEPPDWERSRPYMSTWVLIPEIAIDWNRYRLGRTEKDLLPEIDKTKHRWANGKPFTFQAGFDGDERAYNNETCVYDRQYSAAAPYQFLYGMFSYSLLPSAQVEPQDFKITRHLPITPEEKQGEDIFTETQVSVNRYGEWVKGAASTHRLRTRDPLYGDLFGYTGFEQATTGDYIWLGGIKDRHHRRVGADAWNLVRRTCYAFVTAGPVYPATVNDPDTNNLFVKTLVVKQDGRDVLAVYAVNNDAKPHTLDVSLPAPGGGPMAAQVFDDKAGDWADAKEMKLSPEAGLIRVKATLPAVSPWCAFIYPEPAAAWGAFTPFTTPQPLGPWGNAAVATPEVALRWRPAVGPKGAKLKPPTYEVQVAKEKLFRPDDLVATMGSLQAAETKVTAKLEPNRRYHWRVRALDAEGGSTGWSPAQSFWFQPGAGAAPAAVTGDAPAQELKVPRPDAQPDLKPFTDPDNLATAGVPFSHPNFWEGAAEAIDGFAGSAWMADETDPNEGRKGLLPCWWAVRFDAEQPVSRVAVLWADGRAAKDFDVQTWDGKAWKSAKSVKGNTGVKSEVKLDAPVKTRAVRLWMTAGPGAPAAGGAAPSVAIAEVYVH